MSETAAPSEPRRHDIAPASWVWFWKGQIGRRLLILILAASSLTTLVLTSVQLYLDYRRDVDGIEARLAEIERGYLSSLAGSLWKLDREQLQLQVDGIARLPDVLGAGVEELHGMLRVRSGTVDADAPFHRTVPIVYHDRGETRTLGSLQVTATLEGVYRRIAERALIIVLSQGVKTFLISLFILFIVHRVVTMRLGALAGQIAAWDIGAPAPPAMVPKEGEVPDELEQLRGSFAALQSRLSDVYADLRVANRELQDDLIARRRSEEQIAQLNRSLEERVRQRTEELESANRELAAFTYSVSHDLRAPLRAIHGFSHLVTMECTDQISEQARHYLARVQAAVERMESLIDDLLRLSQVGQRAMKPERVDLSEIAASVARELQAGDSGRSVAWSIEPGLVATGDAGLLRVVLENLLGNAWKYTGKSEHACIVFGRCEVNSEQVFFVRDDGVGFDMKYAERLFIAFQRLHTPAEFPGTGIGLATVSRVIHRHGGRVWAEAILGEGACFYFTVGGAGHAS